MSKLFLFFYIIFLFSFSIFSYAFVDPNLFYFKNLYTGFFSLYRPAITVIFIISIFIFFVFYLLIMSKAKQKELSSKHFFLLIVLTSIILLFSYPAMLSFDIFNYIATAKVTFFYHENPYIIMPIEFTKDPILLFMHAANKIALYAPFWILLTGIPFLLGFGNFLLILLNFKLFSIAFYGLTVYLLWKMTKSVYKTAFFACNPLIVVEFLVSGHNDIAMMFLLLLSIYFYSNNKRKESAFFYFLSTGIKYVTLILIPIYVIGFIKKWKQEKFLFWITVSMFVIFLLSAFREEIYPWYAAWFLLPGTFLIDNKIVFYSLVSISFGLLLRYIPFMLLGTYFGPTPILKFILMVLPVLCTFIWIGCIKVYKAK